MSLADGTGSSADGVFVSLTSVVALLGRFHQCGGVGAGAGMLVSHRQGGAVSLACSSCPARVDGVRDELGPLVRARGAQLRHALELDHAGQERLLAVLRDQPDQQQQQQQLGPGMLQQQSRPTAVQQQASVGSQQHNQPLQHQQPERQYERQNNTATQQIEQRSNPSQEQANADKVPPPEKKTKSMYKSARCEVCSKVFYKRSNLRVHMLRHLGVRPHWCQSCGKSFSDPSTYSRHVASVCGGQRHLTCHVCGKAFYHQVHLKEHLRKHTGEKPYSCEECGKTYACQGSLRRHRSGQCPGGGGRGAHICSICGKAFRQPEALPAHCRLHAGVTLPPGRRPPGTAVGTAGVTGAELTAAQVVTAIGNTAGPLVETRTVAAPTAGLATRTVSVPTAGLASRTVVLPAMGPASRALSVTVPVACLTTRTETMPVTGMTTRTVAESDVGIGTERPGGAAVNAGVASMHTGGVAMHCAQAPVVSTVSVAQVKQAMFGM